MKKYSILALVFVLTAVLFVGCGCTNRNMDNTSAPTLLPTETTRATTEATTEMTTIPTTDTTMPSTNETIDNGNGPLEDNAIGTDTEDTVRNTPNG